MKYAREERQGFLQACEDLRDQVWAVVQRRLEPVAWWLAKCIERAKETRHGA